VEIIGERGIMKIGDNQKEAIVVCTNRDQGLITPIYRTWSERFAWGYVGELQHFVHCIQTGTPPRVSGEDGRWAVAGALAGNRSFLEERPVYLSEVLKEAG
jgi:predicted dehydrogenase